MQIGDAGAFALDDVQSFLQCQIPLVDVRHRLGDLEVLARISESLELLLHHFAFVVDVVAVVPTYRLVSDVLMQVFLLPAFFFLDQF